MTLNFNLFETNLVNLAIVIGVLFWFLPGFLGSILEKRRSAILEDLQDAESRLKTATQELEKAQSELAAAKQKADKIRVDGQARAAAIREEGEKLFSVRPCVLVDHLCVCCQFRYLFPS